MFVKSSLLGLVRHHNKCRECIFCQQTLKHFSSSSSPIVFPGIDSKANTSKVIRHELRSSDSGFLGQLKSRIKFLGPLTVADFMRECAWNPHHGFYTTKVRLRGISSRHFVTSPELSHIFGECLAVWFYNEWKKMGSPSPFRIVELGPGSGILLSDILHTLQNINPKMVSDDLNHLKSIVLVEKSTRLMKTQREVLCNKLDSNLSDMTVATKFGPPCHWVSDVKGAKSVDGDLFTFYLAHEFFDALPVHLFVREKVTSEKEAGQWREVLVGVNRDTDQLQFMKSSTQTPMVVTFKRDFLNHLDHSYDSVEVCPEGLTIVDEISDNICQHGGVMLICDYGSRSAHPRDTLRSFHEHKVVSDPLSKVGECDITADVDFLSFIRRCTSQNADGSGGQPKCLTHGPVSQAYFLSNLKISQRFERVKTLNRLKGEEYKLNMDATYDYMMKGMGERFQFVSLFPETMRDIHEKYPPHGFM